MRQSYRYRTSIVVSGLALLFAAGCADDGTFRGLGNVLATEEPAVAPAFDSEHRAFRSVPNGAVVTLELDKTEYLLGENVLLHYVIENTSDEPFEIDMGGDYRLASRSLRYRITATDEKGKFVADPDPVGFCMGGLMSRPEIKPGTKQAFSLALPRYCKFDKPGRYKIRVEHDLGWREEDGRQRPVGETTIIFKMPSARQADQLVAHYEQLPVPDGMSIGGRAVEYADFSTLRLPIYLKPLTKLAGKGVQAAIAGIGGIETPAATAALIDLLEHEDEQIALLAAQTLNWRLPDPQFEGKLPRHALNDSTGRRKQLSQATWDSSFALPIRKVAIKFVNRKNPAFVRAGAFMLQCVGSQRDLPAVIAALDRSLDGLKPRREHDANILAPPGAGSNLLLTLQVLEAGGAKVSNRPKSSGEVVFYLEKLAADVNFRPAGWSEACAGWLHHDNPYVRESVLRNTPLPLSDAFKARLPELFEDPDLGVQRAACLLAQKTRDPILVWHVLKVFGESKHRWVLNAARNAAVNLGATADVVRISAECMHEPDMLSEAMNSFTLIVQHSGGRGRNSNVPHEEVLAMQESWLDFLDEQFDEIEKGKRFKIGDPLLKPELFGTACTFYLDDNSPWPPKP